LTGSRDFTPALLVLFFKKKLLVIFEFFLNANNYGAFKCKDSKKRNYFPLLEERIEM